jgi:hypothetical protein
MAAKNRSLGTMAGLLADWRAAGRDVVAARAAQAVAALALKSAAGAERAAVQTQKSAPAALSAARQAQPAAASAQKAATQAAEAARLVSAMAERDKVAANHAAPRASDFTLLKRRHFPRMRGTSAALATASMQRGR